MFEYQVQLLRWQLRLNARMNNLSDDYPAFGLTATEEHTSLEAPCPEKISRGTTLLRFFLGVFYVILPHFLILYFRILWGDYFILSCFLGGVVYGKISCQLAHFFDRNPQMAVPSMPLYE
jgi:hypothetical protein